jgi:hypothetical protein
MVTEPSLFQWYVLGISSILNLVFSVTPIISFTIGKTIERLCAETENIFYRTRAGVSVQDAHKDARTTTLELIGGSKLFGATIGFFERQAYLYSLAVLPSLMTGVLLFKAFFSWINSSAITEASHRQLAIAQYYSYALGNLISLIWAIVFYHLAQLAVRYFHLLAAT